MKKIFTILGVAVITSITAQTVLTQWNFDSSPSPVSTSVGIGAAILIGGVVENIQTGTSSCNCSYVAGNPSTGKSYTTKAYPAQSTASGTAGIQFSVNTVGISTVAMSIEIYGSNTASKFVQVQYTTDGSSWTNVTAMPTSLAPSAWSTVSANLPETASNNPNFAFRVVAVFDPSNNTTYSAIGTSSNYGAAGAIRFDNVNVYSSSLAVLDFNGIKVNLIKNTNVRDVIVFGAKANVQIINVNGQVVKTASVAENTSLDVSSLAKGVYIISAEVNGQKVSQKIIKN
ncbi:T9SS type A sorting domain-containing protein [Chryseobacterium gotjawalense]|uniref:T9SS type A sorting domain-containing protein n=1 Tax=Chryseobacterium gotjawalense TaxID=3042315 RepID=A0ABY8RCQ7_9FLAO|nr:T9SS type A sorting domain-containing protein [Chryseobacterium sp. wdc7]WHF51646.1 T9SS type A sorting domain-containing protein [Chryseobacterium sp. wdc7]